MLVRYVDVQNEGANSQDRVHIASSIPHIARSLGYIAQDSIRVVFVRSNPFLARLAYFARSWLVCARFLMLYSQDQTRFLARSAFFARLTLFSARSVVLFASSIPLLSKLPIYI